MVTCPDWTVRDLVSHVGGLHRWSTELVASGIVAETWRSSLPLDYPDGAAPLEAWRLLGPQEQQPRDGGGARVLRRQRDEPGGGAGSSMCVTSRPRSASPFT